MYIKIKGSKTMKKRKLINKILLKVKQKIYGFVMISIIFCNSISCNIDTKEERQEESFINYQKAEETELSEPYFLGIKDFYVVQGNSVDYQQNIKAIGRNGENITTDIWIDASNVVLDEIGSYELIYTAEDLEGNKAQESCYVYVKTAEDIQSLIYNHEISVEIAYIIGAENPYDGGIFQNSDIETVLEAMEPAFVNVCFENKKESSIGSGFIIEITEETIFIFTNAHVVNNQKDVEIYFYNGRCVTGQVMAIKESLDMAVIEVNTKVFSQDFINTLRTVHIDEEYWKELKNHAPISIGYRCLNEKGILKYQETGEVISKEEILWVVDSPVTKYTMKNQQGASGSAVLDSTGNLIAMVLGTSKEEGIEENWGVRLVDILQFYREVSGFSVSNLYASVRHGTRKSGL